MLFRLFIFYLFICTGFSCSFSKGIKDGESAFERKQYSVAIELLQAEYDEARKQQYKGRKAYLLGLSYGKLQNFGESAKWLEMASNNDYGPEALNALASVQKMLENYNAAIASYEKLRSLTGKKQEYDREILICRQAVLSKQKTSDYITERIFENSQVSDYSPVLFENDFLVFTSERTESSGKNIYNWTGAKFSDIFITLKTGSEVRKFDSAINSEHNDGTPWFSRDMNTMYFTRCFSNANTDARCKLMSSSRINEIWDEPVTLPFVKDIANYSQPTLIENDSVLVFASDLEQSGGTTDLFYTELLDDGSWTDPEKLPEVINTQGNEKFPTGDGDTLYFSSDYLPGLGGFDIFKTFLRSDFSWAPPVNMGYGINSGGDEFSFVVDYNAKQRSGIAQQGYFSSSRPGTGKDDIYRFSKVIPKPAITPDTVTKKDTLQEIVRSLFLTVKVFTPEYKVMDDPNSGILSKKLLTSVFVRISDDKEQKIAEGYTNASGIFYSAVPLEKDIKITAMKVEYLNNSAIVNLKNLTWATGETTKTINTELILERIFLNKEINLSNIYYDYDKWDIKSEAIPTLKQLANIIRENPKIKVQLSSHTDCRGADDYNQILSQKRAQSVVDFLVLEGINPARLVPVGYGETALIETCDCDTCTEDQHQVNRRTTFKIIK